MEVIKIGNAELHHETTTNGAYIQSSSKLKIGPLVIARNIDFGTAISICNLLKNVSPSDTRNIRRALDEYAQATVLSS